MSGIAAEVRRDQFSKLELDHMGYPTNTALATELGRSEARRDLTNGIVRLPAYGLPSMEYLENRENLKSRYGIQMYPLAGCLITRGLDAYANGYSEVARKFIESQHGTNIWKDAQTRNVKPPTEGQAPTKKAVPRQGEYRVRAGDTFSHIAKERGVTLKALTDANPKLDPTKLKIGQIIFVPEQSIP